MSITGSVGVGGRNQDTVTVKTVQQLLQRNEDIFSFVPMARDGTTKPLKRSNSFNPVLCLARMALINIHGNDTLEWQYAVLITVIPGGE